MEPSVITKLKSGQLFLIHLDPIFFLLTWFNPYFGTLSVWTRPEAASLLKAPSHNTITRERRVAGKPNKLNKLEALLDAGVTYSRILDDADIERSRRD